MFSCFTLNTLPLMCLFDDLYILSDESGTSLKIMGVQMHVITGPEGMNAVLNRHANKFTKTAIDARILGPATKEGLLSVHGEQWRRQRRAVAPMFRHRHMSDLAPLITDVLRAFKAKLDVSPHTELNLAMADLTFDVLAKCLLGDPKGLDRETLKPFASRCATPDRATRAMGSASFKACGRKITGLAVGDLRG